MPLASPLTIWTSYLLREAALRAQDRVVAALGAEGLRPPHNAVLAMLAESPHSQAELALMLHTDRTSMVALIDDLEAMELVERRRNLSDRRAHSVTLTEAGIKRVVAGLSAMQMAEETFFATLSPSELTQFRELLIRLIEAHDGVIASWE